MHDTDRRMMTVRYYQHDPDEQCVVQVYAASEEEAVEHAHDQVFGPCNVVSVE